MATSQLGFDIFAKDRASRVFDKVGKSADRTGRTFDRVGKGLAKVGKIAAVGLVAGVGGAAVALRKFTGDARESERVTKLTAAIIKSTGGVAKVSAKQVAALSMSISNKTGVDDEAIQTGSNLLLTFKNIHNEVGKGAKIFDRATASAVDLSAAGFGSIESASKMLGKALNDPIKGMTALGRAGVTFTEAQKKQVKTMVEAGDILGAQKLILEEVESQVGGAAAATGTAMDKLKVKLGNVSETIGTALLPAVDSAAKWLGDKLPKAIDRIKDFAGPIIAKIHDALPKIKAAFLTWASAAKGAAQPLISGFQAGLDSGNWGPLGKAIGDGLSNALDTLVINGAKLGAAVGRMVKGVDWLAAGKKASAAAVPFFIGFVNDLIVNFGKFIKEHPMDAAVFVASLIPAGRIAGLLGKAFGKIPILGPLLRFFERIGGFVEKGAGFVLRAVWRAVTFIGRAFLDGFRRVFPGVGASLGKWLALLPIRIGVAALNVAAKARAMVAGLGRAIAGGVGRVAGAVGQLVARIIKPFAGAAGWLINAGRNVVRGFVSGITGMAGAAANAASNMAKNAVNAAKRFLHISSPSKVFLKIGNQVAQGLAIGIDRGRAKAAAAAGNLAKLVTRVLERALGKIRSKLSDLVSKSRDMASGIADGIRGSFDVSAAGDSTTSFMASLSATVANAKKFALALAAAKKNGVNAGLLAQIAQAGPESGMAAAVSLSTATKGQVGQINSDVGQLNKYAGQAGNTAANAMYGAQIASLKRQEKLVEKALSRPIQAHLYGPTNKILISWLLSAQRANGGTLPIHT